jgi:hypothetical protein
MGVEFDIEEVSHHKRIGLFHRPRYSGRFPQLNLDPWHFAVEIVGRSKAFSEEHSG